MSEPVVQRQAAQDDKVTDYWCPSEQRWVWCPGPCPDGREHTPRSAIVTAVPDPQEALREQIAQAIHAAEAHTQALEAEVFDNQMRWLKAQRDLTALRVENESLRDKMAHVLDHWSREIKAAESMLAERNAAHDELASLRNAVSRLADELQKDAAHARKRQSDPADALALNRFLGDERAYLHAARRLRSLLGDKETQCPGL